jgi:hypothetical protein
LGRGAAAAGLTQLGCSGGEAAAAVVEVDEHRALVPVWSGSHPALEIVVEANGSILSRSLASLGKGGTGVARLARLAPATTHRAIVTAGQTELLERTFSTAPAADDTRNVRIAVIADVNVDRDTSLFEHVALAAADFSVSLGDFPYVDDSGELRPIGEVLSRHVDARTSGDLQPWLARTSLRAIYDDHEFCNNWGGGDLRGDHFTACEVALSIWDGFFPRHDRLGPRYRSWRWGAHVECFLLDTRRYRSPARRPDDATKTMLGFAQRSWLIDAVTRSTAPFKIVFSSVPLDFGNGKDHWSGFRFERDLILGAFARAGTRGILFVSGDQHWFGAHVHRHGLREFQIGPAAGLLFDPPPSAPGVIHRAVEHNFGVIDVSAGRLRFRAVGDRARTLYDETFTPDDLRAQDPSSFFR